MTRLREIEIHGFRGVLGNLAVTLGGQSLAIYGDNAIGKSSIADAIEWFYTGRVGHLWKENCKEAALRNVLLPDTAESTVSLSFTDKRLNCTKSISASLEAKYSNVSSDFQNHLQKVREGQERIILRNVDLWNFVLSTKTEKRQGLAELIGYESLDSFREVMSQVQNRLENTSDYIAAKRNIPEYQREIFKITGIMLATTAELYKHASGMAEEVGTSVTIADEGSYSLAIDELRKRIEGKEKAVLKLALSQCRESCEQLEPKSIEARDTYRTFSGVYEDLIRSEQDVRQIRLETFLTLGEKAINESLADADTCPLCLQSKPWPLLREELKGRIAKLRESKKKADAAEAVKGRALASLGEAVSIARDLYKTASKAGFGPEFLDTIKRYGLTLVDLDTKIKTNFGKFQAISSSIESETILIGKSIEDYSIKLKAQIDALELSKDEKKLFETIRNLENLKLSYDKHRGAAETADKFDRQIGTIAAIAHKFAKVHVDSLQQVLDLLSTDISCFYLAMHPGEQVDDIKLTVLEEGIEFEYGFHGRRVYPPLKYLSESHLNSLGIAAFLASAKRFNKATDFMVLDDIVTSFDSNHRLRLVRLLHDDFADRQFLILTHEPFWFQIIKKQLGSKGWLFGDLEEGPGSALQIKGSPRSFVEHVVTQKGEGSLTANELRTCLERILKEVAAALEVKVAFRFNDENERRMSGELISELRSTLKRKSTDTLSEPIFARLEVCALVATAGSHDSGPVLSSGDIAATCEDILKLNEIFFCAECEEYISIEHFVGHEKKAFCKCGKKYVQWKE
jgi:RecF/RecN/SMC family protein